MSSFIVLQERLPNTRTNTTSLVVGQLIAVSTCTPLENSILFRALLLTATILVLARIRLCKGVCLSEIVENNVRVAHKQDPMLIKVVNTLEILFYARLPLCMILSFDWFLCSPSFFLFESNCFELTTLSVHSLSRPASLIQAFCRNKL